MTMANSRRAADAPQLLATPALKHENDFISRLRQRERTMASIVPPIWQPKLPRKGKFAELWT
jgi:hypothetical protein